VTVLVVYFVVVVRECDSCVGGVHVRVTVLVGYCVSAEWMSLFLSGLRSRGMCHREQLKYWCQGVYVGCDAWHLRAGNC
jgi:hypothetical protein